MTSLAPGLNRLRIILEMIKIEHSIFALPFALVGAVLAEHRIPDARTLGWITVAMVGARSSAMAFNRVVDLEFDRRNPRTSTRALPTGALGAAQVWAFTLVTAGILVLAAQQLNTLSLTLSPVALAIIWGYSYTKRFTAWCHVVLGLAIGIAPAAAWIAVSGRLELPAVLLTVAVMLWVGGFDVIYSLQDETFDREAGLHSMPSRWGAARALAVSRMMHVLMAGLLLALPALLPLGWMYLAGVAGVVGLLAYEHSLVRPDDLSRVNAAFFTVNGFVSVGFFVTTLLDVMMTGR